MIPLVHASKSWFCSAVVAVAAPFSMFGEHESNTGHFGLLI